MFSVWIYRDNTYKTSECLAHNKYQKGKHQDKMPYWIAVLSPPSDREAKDRERVNPFKTTLLVGHRTGVQIHACPPPKQVLLISHSSTENPPGHASCHHDHEDDNRQGPGGDHGSERSGLLLRAPFAFPSSEIPKAELLSLV